MFALFWGDIMAIGLARLSSRSGFIAFRRGQVDLSAFLEKQRLSGSVPVQIEVACIVGMSTLPTKPMIP